MSLEERLWRFYLARIGYGVLPVLLSVRVIKASVTATLADGTVRTEQWRLLTSRRGPGGALLREERAEVQVAVHVQLEPAAP